MGSYRWEKILHEKEGSDNSNPWDTEPTHPLTHSPTHSLTGVSQNPVAHSSLRHSETFLRNSALIPAFGRQRPAWSIE